MCKHALARSGSAHGLFNGQTAGGAITGRCCTAASLAAHPNSDAAAVRSVTSWSEIEMISPSSTQPPSANTA